MSTDAQARSDRPNRTPHTAHLREFRLPDGRPLLIDRRGIGFLVPVKGTAEQTIIGLKVPGAKPCPVMATYDDVKRWWYAEKQS